MTLGWDDASTGKVNEERTATLTFKENNIRAIYIDWDDGESNKIEESNYQWVETTEPKGSFVVKHTYNKSGTFKPVIQTINSYGFVSRFNANESSNSDISPFTNNSGIQNIVVNDNSPTAIARLDKVLTKISNAEENLKTLSKYFDTNNDDDIPF